MFTVYEDQYDNGKHAGGVNSLMIEASLAMPKFFDSLVC